MSRRFKLLGAALGVAAILALGFTGVAFATAAEGAGDTAITYGEELGWGEPGDCTGPGDMHRWGEQNGQGACYGEPGDCTDPGDMHRWGEQNGQGACYGEPGDCTGPGDMHQWGRGQG